MNVGQLREMLEQYGADVEVRVVHQENYPLVERLGGIYDPTENQAECQECGYGKYTPDHDAKSEDFSHNFDGGADVGNAILLVATGHPSEGSPYGPRCAWEQMERAW